MSLVPRSLKHGASVAWTFLLGVPLLIAISILLSWRTLEARHVRDVNRMSFNDNLDLLERIKQQVGQSADSLARVQSSGSEAPADRPYIVVSIAENRLWYKQGNNVLFQTRVATGSGKVLEQEGGDNQWKFETPRGRLVVERKDLDPAWVPPDWHFVEMARKKGLGVVRLNRGQAIPAGDGSVITVDGNDVVKKYGDGREVPLEAKEGREIVAGGNVVVPPYGTNQRKYMGVLGTHRLYLGDGYGLHGTDHPETIGQSVSHGCVRLKNEDIETLYNMVPLGTPVYIY